MHDTDPPSIDHEYDSRAFLSRKCFARYATAGIDLVTRDISMERPPCLKAVEYEHLPLVVVDDEYRGTIRRANRMPACPAYTGADYPVSTG
jgi:hypothetical protein